MFDARLAVARGGAKERVVTLTSGNKRKKRNEKGDHDEFEMNVSMNKDNDNLVWTRYEDEP